MMRIVFFGTPDFAVPSLDRLLERSEFNVLGVVTQPDKRRGRGSALSFSPIKERAVQQNLPLWQPHRIKKDPETLQALAALEADIFAVVAYGQLLSPELLAMPRLGCVNVHGSLLPRYRGAAPIQWSLYNGDGETGITTMLMDVGMDTGDMLLKSITPIGLLDTAESLGDRLAQQGAALLVETLLRWSDLQPEPQDPAQATAAPLIQKEDYILRWERSALALHNQIRGFYPQGQTQFRGKLLKVSGSIPLGVPCPLPEPWSDVARQWSASLAERPAERPVESPAEPDTKSQTKSQANIPPGTVVDLIKHHGPVIQTGEGYLLLTQVQPAGKRSLSGWDFVNGARVGVGDCLEN